jgi:hypothetical protein
MAPTKPTTCTQCGVAFEVMSTIVLAGPPDIRASALGDPVTRWETTTPRPYHHDHVPNGMVVTRTWSDDKPGWE